MALRDDRNFYIQHYHETNSRVNDFDKILELFGQNIRYCRSRIPNRTMTQVSNELRDKYKVKLSPSLLSLIERGEVKNINLNNLVQLANYYREKLDDMLSIDISTKHL